MFTHMARGHRWFVDRGLRITQGTSRHNSIYVGRWLDSTNYTTYISMVGLVGTYLIDSDQIYECLDAALAAGYRHIDTAAVYRNEEAIGQSLKELLPKHGLKREDIFITTKLSPRDMGESRVQEAVECALLSLETPYIDLFLIHWPGAHGIATTNTQNPRFRMETWRELIRLHDQGRGVLRAIGVSNFMAKHVEQIITLTGFAPAVNQVEYHPYYTHPKELYQVCIKHNILLQAYSSLGGTGNNKVMENKVVQKCADKHNVTPAQLLLRWALQVGYAIIPKAVTPEKIKMNSELDFTLDKETMYQVSSIYMRDFCCKFAWDPSSVM